MGDRRSKKQRVEHLTPTLSPIEAEREKLWPAQAPNSQLRTPNCES